LLEFIKEYKDSLPCEKKSNVVYKICYKDCDASYIGQTGRQLKRIAEHRNHIGWNTTIHSIKTDRLEKGLRIWLGKYCNFGWGTLIRDWCQKCYTSRDGLNLQTDLERPLPKAYFPIVDKYRSVVIAQSVYIFCYIKIKLLKIQFWFWCPSGL